MQTHTSMELFLSANVYVHVCWYARMRKTAMGISPLLLCTSLFLRQGLSLYMELTSRLDWLPERPRAPPTSPCTALLLILFVF